MGFFDYEVIEQKIIPKKVRKISIYKQLKQCAHKTKNGMGVISRLIKKK